MKSSGDSPIIGNHMPHKNGKRLGSAKRRDHVAYSYHYLIGYTYEACAYTKIYSVATHGT